MHVSARWDIWEYEETIELEQAGIQCDGMKSCSLNTLLRHVVYMGSRTVVNMSVGVASGSDFGAFELLSQIVISFCKS